VTGIEDRMEAAVSNISPLPAMATKAPRTTIGFLLRLNRVGGRP
jgi:hypothetical protein